MSGSFSRNDLHAMPEVTRNERWVRHGQAWKCVGCRGVVSALHVPEACRAVKRPMVTLGSSIHSPLLLGGRQRGRGTKLAPGSVETSGARARRRSAEPRRAEGDYGLAAAPAGAATRRGRSGLRQVSPPQVSLRSSWLSPRLSAQPGSVSCAPARRSFSPACEGTACMTPG